MKFLKIALLTPLLAIALFACEPTSLNDGEPDREFAREVSNVAAAFDDAFQLGDLAMAEAGVFKTNQLCADVSADTVNRLITVDFGTGCIGPDGITRSGLFIVHYIGRHRQAGSQFSITFDQYTVEGEELNGTVAITNFDLNSSNQVFFTISVTDGLLINAVGDSVGYDGIRTFTWVDGQSTPFNISDDAYEVTGNATGFNSEGQSYMLNINQALLYKQECALQGNKWPVSGELEISSSEFVGTLKVEYGQGICDHSATLTWRNRQYQLDL